MKEDFLVELSALLGKYNATIWFGCGAGYYFPEIEYKGITIKKL